MITVIPWIAIGIIALYGANMGVKNDPKGSWYYYFIGHLIVWGGLWLFCMWMAGKFLHFIEG